MHKIFKMEGGFNLEFLDFLLSYKKRSLETRVLHFMNVATLSNNDEKMIKKFVNIIMVKQSLHIFNV